MKTRYSFIAALLALMLLLSACGDVTVTVEPSASIPEVASYTGVAVRTINAPADADFGLIEDYYTAEGSTTVTLGEVGGDADVLNPTGFRVTTDSLSVNSIDVLFDAEFPVAFTAKQYTNGEVTGDGGIMPLESGGIVEKYNADGTWSRAEFAELRTPGEYENPPGIQMTLAKDDFPTLKDGAVSMALPFENPGVYRYTLYFRECIDDTEENRTTGEEMYTLSVIFDIPKSDKLFDIVAVSGFFKQPVWMGKYAGETGQSISILFRVNTADDFEALQMGPVYMAEYGMLERREGDAWTELPDALYLFPEGERYGDGAPPDMSNRFLHKCDISAVYFPELKGEYRMDTVFSGGFEKNDHTRYDLTLHFNFDE